MKDRKQSMFVGFLVAVVAATVWGSIVQTQYNLAGIASVGAAIPAGLRIRATLADVASGFTPTYAGYVVAPALLVAFVVATWVAGPRRDSRLVWFTVAGGLALLLAIPIVNYLAPVALLIGATRDWSCAFLMALGGAAAGYLFAAVTARPGAASSNEPMGVEPSTVR